MLPLCALFLNGFLFNARGTSKVNASVQQIWFQFFLCYFMKTPHCVEISLRLYKFEQSMNVKDSVLLKHTFFYFYYIFRYLLVVLVIKDNA